MSDKGTTLSSDQFLMVGDYLMSPNGKYQLVLQADGNLVLNNLTSHGQAWASHTDGKAVSRATMQSDGNFVIYGFPDHIWSSQTDGKPNSILSVQDDGNVVIYDNVALWASKDHP